MQFEKSSFQYLKDLSVNPQGMVDLFKALQAVSPDLGENADKLMKIMSTHPLTQDRINLAEEMIASLPNKEYEERPELARIFASLQSKDKDVSDETDSSDELTLPRREEDTDATKTETN